MMQNSSPHRMECTLSIGYRIWHCDVSHWTDLGNVLLFLKVMSFSSVFPVIPIPTLLAP